MQLVKKYEIQSRDRIIEFLNSQPTGRIASIDKDGYPQVIPMNFVYYNDMVYMHSQPVGEKLANIRANKRVGFEVDQHLCFLPSYYFHPTDASQADTLYISVVVKGRAEIVPDNEEKADALNALMRKYQKEGRHELLKSSMSSVNEVAVIKVIPEEMRGKYKVGQHWARPYRIKIAKSILEREGFEKSRHIFNIMGINIAENGSSLQVKEDPVM
ncbi:MAG TPA: pyridoxamine 5'-phosphate oxidase family protein [Nitrososphaera sp.]|jgi:nitroimidazol reductase NimA-like FMN-containing flavoprotein (pyridoxamine 5'-phosphate oxidase superfamily)